MFFGALTIGCSAVATGPSSQFNQESTQKDCKKKVPTSTSEKERWEKALCILNLSARKWRKKRIEKKVKKLESELNEKLPFSYRAFISNWFIFPLSPYFYKLSKTKKLPAEFESAVKERLDEKFDYPFIPPIVFSIESSKSDELVIDYDAKYDLIKLNPSYMEKLLKNGLEKVALNAIEVHIPFIMAIRKNKIEQKGYYYGLKTKKSGKKKILSFLRSMLSH